ncbi:hypothetical protein [Candidatus Leptofilum sp.]|uniref:nSTAND1 domain-containing NTPase n=1 Tax=Candidatus Leptofilum sp. TaxID=3241576 RepID=UPI003B5939B3
MSETNPQTSGDQYKIGEIKDSEAIAIGPGASAHYHQGLTFEEVAALVVELKNQDQPTVWNGRIPYLGLAAYQEADAQYFFGREGLVQELLQRVQEANFITIAGPSGSGKSSLARAGLFYTLRQGIAIERSDRWLLATMQPKGVPFGQLAKAMEKATKSIAVGDALQPEDNAYPTAEMLLRHVEMYLEGDDGRCVLLVDQFEELFTQTKDPEQRQAFINLITQASQEPESRFTVIISLRDDFISHCARHEKLRELLSQQLQLVGAMTSPHLSKAITLPALKVGADIDDYLVSRIISDMKGSPDALPLMSFALRDLFEVEKTKPGKPMDLTLPEYLQRGGLEKALEEHANKVFENFTEEQQEIAKNIFSKLIEVGQGRVDTRRTATFAELVPANSNAEVVKAVLSQLANSRLVTTSGMSIEDGEDMVLNESGVTVAITHEKILDAWPWLRKLIDENRDAIKIENEIAQAASQWAKLNRDSGALFRGARLQQALEWFEKSEKRLSMLSARFLGASRELAEMEIREKEKQRRRELDHQRALAKEQQKRAEEAEIAAIKLKQRRNIAFGIGFVALIAAIVASLFGVSASNSEAKAVAEATKSYNAESTAVGAAATAEFAQGEAEVERNLAIEQGKISLALSLSAQVPRLANDQIDQDDELATLLAIEAQRLNSETGNTIDKVVDNALRSLFIQDYYASILIGNDSPMKLATFSSDGQSIAFLDSENSLWFWDISAPNFSPVNLKGATSDENILAFSTEKNLLASGGRSGVVKLWDLNNLASEPKIIEGHDGGVTSLAFDSDGVNLAVGTRTGWISIWRILDSPNITFSLRSSYQAHQGEIGTSSSVTTLTFTDDGRFFVSGSMDGTVKLWEVADSEPIPIVFQLPENEWVLDAVFSPDEEKVIVASQDELIVSPLELENQPGTVWMWDISNNNEIPEILFQNEWAVKSLRFSPDGQTIALGGLDGVVNLLSFSNPVDEPITLLGHGSTVNSITFVPEQNKILTSSSDNTVRVWNVSKFHTSFRVLEAHQGVVFSVDFSPNGNSIITASSQFKRMSGVNSGNVRIWQMTNLDANPVLMSNHQGPVFSASYITNEKIASTSMIDPIWLWERSSPEVAPSRIVGFSEEFPSLNESIHILAVSPDGTMIASDSSENEVLIWDALDPGSAPSYLENPLGNTSSLAFSPGSNYLAAGTVDGSILIWDVNESANKHDRFDGENGAILSVSFSPNDDYLAAGTETGKILLWSLSEPDSISYPYVLEGHQGSIRSVYFSSDGKLLASGSDDRTIRLWQIEDLPSIPLPIILDGHEGAVMSVTFSPDNKFLASGSDDGTSRLWNISIGVLAETGCEIVFRNLTWEEWQEYFPTGEIYNQTCPNLPIHSSVPIENRP